MADLPMIVLGRPVGTRVGVAWLVALFAFCPPALASTRSAYVANSGANSVSQYTVASDGTLIPKTPATVPSGFTPYGIAVSPDGKSAYVPDYGGTTISQYTVAADGTLSPKTPAAVATGNAPFGVALSTDGLSAYVTNQGGDSVSQYTIAADGTLAPKTPATVATGTGPFGVTLSADGHSAYVSNQKSDSVSQYTIAADGTLAPNSPATVATGLGPFGVGLSADGQSAYVTNESSDSVSQYTVSADGTLSPKTPATVAAGNSPFRVAVSANGLNAYVANYGGDSVSQYTVAADGTLSPKAPTTVPSGSNPYGIALDAGGTSAYVTNTGGDSVSQYTVAADGTLSPKIPATVPSGASPYGVVLNSDPPPADQSIVFPGQGPYTYGQTPVALGATASSGLAVSYSVASGPCAVSGATLSIAGAGSCLIAADQPGDPNFNPAAAVSRTITVGKADQSIVFAPQGPYALGQAAVALGATASSGLPVSYTVAGGPCAVTGARLTLSDAGSCLITADQAGDANFNAAPAASITVLVAPAAPGSPNAVAGDGQAAVTVTAPTAGGAPTSYTVTAVDSIAAANGGQTCTVNGAAGSCTVGGLTDGDSYTFTATATSAAGTSGQSPPSNAVVPLAPARPAYKPSTYAPALGQTVSFDAAASRASTGATIAAYDWKWGDGTPDGSGPTPTHVFTTAGRFSVGLYLTDSAGHTAAVGHGITVSGGA